MKTGWIVKNRNDGLFLDGVNWGSCQAKKLRDAHTFDSRANARDYKLDHESVLKVSLTKNGNAKKVIGRG